MPTLSQCVAVTVNDEEIGLQEALSRAKWRQQLRWIEDTIDAALIRQAAAEQGVEVPEDELQEAADAFRQARDLEDVEATARWLSANHLPEAEWVTLLEEDLLTRRMRDLVTAGKVEQHFAENRLSFESAIISRLVVDDESVARELHAQIVDDAADFHALARRYSGDAASRPAGGYVGVVTRNSL